MFGHESLPSVIYSYGCQPVTDPKAIEQIRLGHQYRNKLVEIELARRKGVEELLLTLSPELPKVEAAIAEADTRLTLLRKEVSRKNSEQRKRGTSAAVRAEIKTCRTTLKNLRAERKSLRAELFRSPKFRRRSKDIDEETRTAQRLARKEFSREHKLYWGTYLAVEQSMKGARKGAPPKFRGWRGDGRCCVQIQGGLKWGEVVGGSDQRLRIGMMPPPARNSQQSKKLALLTLRVGSDRGKPIFTTVPMFLHREPPPGSIVKWVWLKARRVGVKTEWQAQFTLSREEEFADPQILSCTSGAVGVDVGWRRLQYGLRVAYWVGSDGKRGQLVITNENLSRWAKAEELQSIRARNFNAAKSTLANWTNLGHERLSVPEWFAKELQHLHLWKSPRKLRWLVRRWSTNRFAGDEGIFTPLHAWQTQEDHLYNWQANQLRKALAWRDHLYRNFAADMRRRYRLICVEKTNWSKLQKRPTAEERLDEAARIYQRIASVGRLVQLLTEKAGEVLRVDPKYTTQRCSDCGKMDSFDAAAELVRTCQHCGVTRDQDDRAARNLLAASGQVVVETPGPAR